MSRSKTAHVLNQASKAVQSKFSETWMEGASKGPVAALVLGFHLLSCCMKK